MALFLTHYGRAGRTRIGLGTPGSYRPSDVTDFLRAHGFDPTSKGRLKIDFVTGIAPESPVEVSSDASVRGHLRMLTAEAALVRLPDDRYEEFVIAQREESEAGAACPCLGLGGWPERVTFTSRGFVEGGIDGVVEVRRARREWPRLDPTMAASVHERCRLAGRWLLRSQADNGAFRYMYDPVHDKTVGKYTVTGHAGAVLALAALGRQPGGMPFLDGALLGLKELRSRFRDDPAGKRTLHLDFGEGPSIGATAVTLQALLATLDLHEHGASRDECRALGRFLAGQQHPNGTFGIEGHATDDRREGRLYADGEAALALAALCEHDVDSDHREGVVRAADALARRRTASPPSELVLHDAYLVRVDAAVHRVTHEPRHRRRCLDRAQELARTAPMAAEDANLWNVSAWAEAMVTATDLALALDAPVDDLLPPTLSAARFLLEQQIDADTAYFTRSPRNAEGCFRCARDKNLSCLGYVPGAVKALLGVERLLRATGEKRHRPQLQISG